MIFCVVSARPVGGYRVRLRFEDGRSGTLDISKVVPFDGVFAPLSDAKYFRKVSVYGEGGGTIYWPNGADIDPAVLYSEVAKEPIMWAGRAVYEPVGALIQSGDSAPRARRLTPQQRKGSGWICPDSLTDSALKIAANFRCRAKPPRKLLGLLCVPGALA